MRLLRPNPLERETAVLFAIEVHGPGAIFQRAHLWSFRWFAKHDRDALMQIKHALVEHGMARADVEDLLVKEHWLDCCCWRCIMRLHVAVLKMHAELCLEEIEYYEEDEDETARMAAEQDGGEAGEVVANG